MRIEFIAWHGGKEGNFIAGGCTSSGFRTSSNERVNGLTSAIRDLAQTGGVLWPRRNETNFDFCSWHILSGLGKENDVAKKIVLSQVFTYCFSD